jgi:hypothetical protein
MTEGEAVEELSRQSQSTHRPEKYFVRTVKRAIEIRNKRRFPQREREGIGRIF